MMHTKGKWVSEPAMSSSSHTRDILVAGEPKRIAKVGYRGLDEDIANAHLIAAAPDLLAARKGLIKVFDIPLIIKLNDPGLVRLRAIQTSEAAIAKAENQS